MSTSKARPESERHSRRSERGVVAARPRARSRMPVWGPVPKELLWDCSRVRAGGGGGVGTAPVRPGPIPGILPGATVPPLLVVLAGKGATVAPALPDGQPDGLPGVTVTPSRRAVQRSPTGSRRLG